MAGRFFLPLAPRAMESKELVPAILFFCYHDGKTGNLWKDAWNAGQQAASRPYLALTPAATCYGTR